MKSDLELKKDVQNAINWEPSMCAAEIGVTAKDGVITLSGTVSSYSKKIIAKNAVKKVKGVKDIAEDIIIDNGGAFKMNDTAIAEEILKTWKYNWEVSSDKINVKIEDGWVRLDGDAVWKYEEVAAMDAIKNLSGVKGITSLIKVKAKTNDMSEQKEVENALHAIGRSMRVK